MCINTILNLNNTLPELTFQRRNWHSNVKHGVHSHDWASLRRNSTVANKPLTTGPRTLPRRRHPDLAILSNHLIDRKARVHNQDEVTPQKAFSPPDANKITTLSKIRCHASDVATQKPANKVELMAYKNNNLRRQGTFCDLSLCSV